MKRKARRECMRILNRLVGADALPQFMKTPQPALGDKTGAQLLEHQPAALLERLRILDEQLRKAGTENE